MTRQKAVDSLPDPLQLIALDVPVAFAVSAIFVDVPTSKVKLEIAKINIHGGGLRDEHQFYHLTLANARDLRNQLDCAISTLEESPEPQA